jgi:hypothetical protein
MTHATLGERDRMSWKVWRPVIWLTMIAIAVGVLVNPYLGVLMFGAALGIGVKIARGRRQLPNPAPTPPTGSPRAKPRPGRP